MRFYLGHRLPGGFWAGLSTYARQPHRAVRQAAHATGGIGCVGFVVLVLVIALGIAYWYVSVPVLVLTAIAVGVTVHRQHVHRAQPAGSVSETPAPAPPVPVALTSRVQRAAKAPPLRVPADTFKIGSLVHLEKDGSRTTYFVDHGRTPDEIVLKRVTTAPIETDA
ncbi:MAG: hypothetical protein ACHQ4F_01080 [Candidatus Dormibacteria bacterium]